MSPVPKEMEIRGCVDAGLVERRHAIFHLDEAEAFEGLWVFVAGRVAVQNEA